jgi:ribosomal protein S10
MQSVVETLQMQVTPRPGEALLYVELTAVQNRSVDETLQLLIEMGYSPQLRYLQWAADPNRVSLFALLRQSPYDPEIQGDNYLIDEFHRLCGVIQPEIAVSSPRAVPRHLVAA